jgi:hypothetical protein
MTVLIDLVVVIVATCALLLVVHGAYWFVDKLRLAYNRRQNRRRTGAWWAKRWGE